MGNFSMGGIGDIGSVILGIIGVVITLVIMFTVQPTIAGGINEGLILNTVNACQIGGEGGELYDRLSAARANATDSADTTWNATTNQTAVTIGAAGAACVLTTAGSSGNVYYTPSGTTITEGDAKALTPAATVKARARMFSDFNGLVRLIGSIIGLILPALALGVIVTIGQRLMPKAGLGTGVLQIIGGVIAIVIITGVLGTVIDAVDTAYVTYTGVRFLLFDYGLGSLANVIASFMGFGILAGLIVLGFLAFPQLAKRFGGAAGRAYSGARARGSRGAGRYTRRFR